MSDDAIYRAHYRMRNHLARVTLNLPDDSLPISQIYQLEGYSGEVRDRVQRLQIFGLSSLPPVGSSGLALFQGGHRGRANGVILGGEHPAYRPTGLKPGEFVLYAVTGADGKGEGGKTRPILRGNLNGKGQLLGVTIEVGDGDTTNVTVQPTFVVGALALCDSFRSLLMNVYLSCGGRSSTPIKSANKIGQKQRKRDFLPGFRGQHSAACPVV